MFRAAPRLAAATLTLQVASSASSGVVLFLLDRLMTTAVANGGPDFTLASVGPELAWLAGVLVVATSAQFLQSGLRTLLSDHVTWRATEQMLDVANAADEAHFDDPDFHDRLTRAQASSSRPVLMVMGLYSVIGGVSSAISLAVVVTALEPMLLAVLVLSATPLLAANNISARRLHETVTGLTENDRRRAYFRSLMTSRTSSTEVRSLGLATFLRSRTEELFAKRIRRVGRTVALSGVRTVLGGVLSTGGLVASLGLLVLQVATGAIPASTASLGAISVVQLSNALGTVLAGLTQLYENALYLDDLRSLRNLLVGLRMRKAALPSVPAPTSFRTISVEGVTFRYPDAPRPSLRRVSLTINRGELVALVGGNGSGKTTLAKVLANLYQPASGRVCWDGYDVAAVDPDAMRSSVAVLQQNFARYMMTVAENIGLGRVERLDDRPAVLEASGRSRADDFVSALPAGYDTELGSQFRGGTDLSGGQWQRLALARAFFRNAPLVILDEPTAALDPQAENLLFQSLQELVDDRTVLLISHRMVGVRAADRIYVLDAGRIVESGNHDELMAHNRRYAELYRYHENLWIRDAADDEQ